jgi:hypothetical protein
MPKEQQDPNTKEQQDPNTIHFWVFKAQMKLHKGEKKNKKIIIIIIIIKTK